MAAKKILMPSCGLGDTVEWTSFGHGSSKTKRGKVVEVVPAGDNVDPTKYPGLRKLLRPVGHETYIVFVTSGPNSKRSAFNPHTDKYYRPRTMNLNIIRRAPAPKEAK